MASCVGLSGSNSRDPCTSLKCPRTHDTIMCRARNSAAVCPGSNTHLAMTNLRWFGALPLVEPAAQQTPDHDELPKVVSVVVSDQQSFPQNGLPFPVRDRSEQI